MQKWADLVLLGLLTVAFVLRVYGLDWDRGFFFHPDERQILMVVARLSWPQNPFTLFTPDSTLNPHFFAYGSFPLYLLRLFASLLSLWRAEWASISRFYLLGRLLSAFFDTLTVLTTYLLARKVYGQRVALLAAGFVTFTVLHIQQAHFYTVDTLLTLLVLLAVNKAVDVARDGRLRNGLQLGLIFGVALATKISVLPLVAVILMAWLVFAWTSPGNWKQSWQQLRAAWQQVKSRVFATFGLAVGCFVLLQPYAVIDGYQFAIGVGQEIAMARGWYDFPYTRQYIGTVPYLYHVRQILLFAMGLPLGLLGLVGLLWLSVRLWRHFSRDDAILLSWPLLYIVANGGAHAKFIRYTLPVLPFLSLASAAIWAHAWDALGRVNSDQALRFQALMRWVLALLLCMVLLATIFYAFAFLNIYRQVHPWLQATDWLCQHAPAGSTILTEYWDDPLPVQGGAKRGGCPKEYVFITLDMYAVDTEDKEAELLSAIETCDYIVLSSQRLYVPILRLSERYSISSRYYQRLFAGQLGFQLVAAPAVYPHWMGITLLDNPRAGLLLSSPSLLATSKPGGLVLNLGQADESFTVYDHPQPFIFAKVLRLSRQELQALLTP
nr:glycosyltransferase family 39 protein [Chloroflexota bacterium]